MIMKSLLQLFARGFAGFGSAALCVPLPFKKYPFTFPEKALTSDWMVLGNDLNRTMEARDDDHRA